MDKDALKNKIAEILGIAVSEKDLAFEMMLNRLSEILNYDDAINIPGIGIFSLKKEPLLREERGENIGVSAKRNLIFLPEATDSTTTSKAMYLTFNLDSSNQDYLEFDENIFSISVGKPLVSASGIQSGASTGDSSEKMLATLEEKVQRLVANTEKISDYDIWNEFASKEDVAKNIDDSIVDDSTDNDLKQMVSENVITQEITDEEPVEEPIEEPEQSVFEENEADSDIELETENIESNSTETVEPDLPEEEASKSDSVVQDESIPDESEKEIELEENSSSEDTNDDSGENEEINWDWGDELKEELEADNPETDSTTEEKISDTTKETTSKDVEENKKTAASELFESVDHSSEDPDKEEDNNDEQVEEELVENEEDESNTDTQTVIYSPGEFEEESAKRSKLDDIKKKFKFGKTLWMLIGVFVLIGILGIYFMFVTGDGTPEVSQQNIPDTLIHKKLQPIENNSDIKNSSNNNTELNSQSDKKKSTIEKSTASKSGDVSKNEVKQLENKNIVNEKSGSLYRSFPDEKQVRNLIFLQNGVYSVQVSSRRNKTKAEQYVKKLRNVGFDAFIVKTYLSQLKSTWYRVRIGYFKTVKEAMNFRIKNKF